MLEGFARLLREAPKEVASRCYLYLHTSYPDQGWELPRLVEEFGVGCRTLFTYFCGACGAYYPSPYADALAICRRCHQPAAVLPDAARGLDRSSLARLYNLMDVFVQCANCEGFGMPLIEAASCGVATMATDYSAMSETVRKTAGLPIQVKAFYKECETHRNMAVPDIDHLVKNLIQFLSLPAPMRVRQGNLAREGVLAHYTYEKTAATWAEHLSRVKPANWKVPIALHNPPSGPPPELSDDEFVRWCIAMVGGRPDLSDSLMALRMSRDLTWGSTGPTMGGLAFNEASALGIGTSRDNRRKPYSRDDVVKQCVEISQLHNRWERERMEVLR